MPLGVQIIFLFNQQVNINKSTAFPGIVKFFFTKTVPHLIPAS